jgi:hypothetical protein
MQDKIQAVQADIDRLSQDLEAVMAEAEKAETSARDRLSKAYEALRNLLIEADSHLPQADRVWPSVTDEESRHGRVVIESLIDNGALQVLTARFVGDSEGPRMQFVKMGNVWKERGKFMELRNVPDNIAEILGAAK